MKGYVFLAAPYRLHETVCSVLGPVERGTPGTLKRNRHLMRQARWVFFACDDQFFLSGRSEGTKAEWVEAHRDYPDRVMGLAFVRDSCVYLVPSFSSLKLELSPRDDQAKLYQTLMELLNLPPLINFDEERMYEEALQEAEDDRAREEYEHWYDDEGEDDIQQALCLNCHEWHWTSIHSPDYFCDDCYEEQLVNGLMVSRCQRCQVAFSHPDTESPIYCKGCRDEEHD